MEQIDIEVWQDGMCVAKVNAHEVDAMREAAHYAMVYGQDGPVAVFLVKRGKRTRIAEHFQCNLTPELSRCAAAEHTYRATTKRSRLE